MAEPAGVRGRRRQAVRSRGLRRLLAAAHDDDRRHPACSARSTPPATCVPTAGTASVARSCTASSRTKPRSASVRRLAEYEDYALRVLAMNGVKVAQTWGIVELTPNREYMLVTEFFEDSKNLGDSEIDDAIIDEGLQLIRQFWDIGVAHRDVKPANLLVQRGHLQLVDVSGLEVRPTPWRQAVDLANMMLTLALQSDPDRVYERATDGLHAGRDRGSVRLRRGHGDPHRALGPAEEGPTTDHGTVQGTRSPPRPGVDPAMEPAADRRSPPARVLGSLILLAMAIDSLFAGLEVVWPRTSSIVPGPFEPAGARTTKRLRLRAVVLVDAEHAAVGRDDRERTGRPDGARIRPWLTAIASSSSTATREVGHRRSERQRFARVSGAAWRRRRRTDRSRFVGARVRWAPHPSAVADVGRQHPHVRAAAADDEEVDIVVPAPGTSKRLHVDRPGVGLQGLALPSGLVELASTDLHGGVRGRALQRDRPPVCDGRIAARTCSSPTSTGCGADDLTVGIQRRGLDPQAHRGLVGLGQVAQEPQQPRGPTDAHDQQSGGHRDRGCRRVRPSSCASARRTWATASWDVMPWGLSISRNPSGPGAGCRRGHGATGSPRSADASRSIVSAGPCAEV